MDLLYNVSQRRTDVEKKLGSLKTLEKKVDGFDRELKKISCAIEDRQKKSDDIIRSIEERAESTDFAVGQTRSKITELENANDRLNDDLVYLQSQSMRSNLVFTNVPESTIEGQVETEEIIRHHLVDKMKITKEQVEKISFEKVHRMGAKQNGRIRNIVAKFTLFKEREYVRKQWKTLEGSNYNVYEQFPKEVVEKRRRLQTKVREHGSKGYTAWITYDTMYVNGRPVRE